MTRVTVYKSADGIYSGFDVRGHAGYADPGEDIVCASVSFLAINTVNAIDRLTKDRIRVSEDKEEGVISMRLDAAPSPETDILLQAFEMGVTQLAGEYKEITTEVRYATEI